MYRSCIRKLVCYVQIHGHRYFSSEQFCEPVVSQIGSELLIEGAGIGQESGRHGIGYQNNICCA